MADSQDNGAVLVQIMERLDKTAAAFNAMGDMVKELAMDVADLKAAKPSMMAAAAGPVDATVLAPMINQALAPIQEQLRELAERPMAPQTDPAQVKIAHAKAVVAESSREQAALGGQGVQTFYHPNPEFCAKQKPRMPVALRVRTMAEVERARGKGYLGSLEDAAAAAKEAGRFPTVEEAQQAIHAAAAADGNSALWPSSGQAA